MGTGDRFTELSFAEFDVSELCELISSREDWMLQRLTTYVVERGFGKYVPPLIESWRLAVAGASESILVGLKELFPQFELGPDDDYAEDPVSRFAILEAHRHRERGVTLKMFLGLLIYFRQIFSDLIRSANFDLEYERCSTYIIHRLFDRMLIAISMEWTEYDQHKLIEDLQANNRLMTNEKNKYLSIFESHPHLVFILDNRNRIDNMNHSAATHFYNARLPGSQYYQVIKDGETTIPVLPVSSKSDSFGTGERASCEGLFPWLAEDLRAFSKSSDLMRSFEKKVDSENGTQYFNVKLSRTIDARKEMDGVILLIEDITSQKMFSEELRLAKERAESANRAKSAFLANISHELRTPLNAILGFTDLMRKSPAINSDQAKNLGIISKSGINLLNLINNVLDISKIEAGHMALEEVDINLKQLLNEITELMSIKVSEKGLGFNVKPAADLSRVIRVDAGKLRQVLTNLISNAVKYTEKGDVTLKVSIAEQDEPKRAGLRFEVTDSGVGIRKEDQEKIFSPFEQVGGQPVSDAGTGLGLAICKQYVDLMGGHIGVSSEPGKGSIFHFEIPASILPATSMSSDKPFSGRIAGVAAGQQRLRILIAEDNPDNRLLLRRLHEPLGFEIQEAVNGKEAVDIHEKWQPHLIWMDIRMPVMSGLDATRHIKEKSNGSETKIVALTAHALEAERIEILKAGCDEFIRKPYRDAEIYGALEKHLGVRFSFSDANPSEDPSVDHQLLQEQMEGIPPGLASRLRDAAVLLDDRICLHAIEGIRAHNHELGNRLCRMVENMQYKEILSTLDRLVPNGEK